MKINPNQNNSILISGTEPSIFLIQPSDTKENMPTEITLAEVLFITPFPPREYGIASYSQDLISAIETKFEKSFTISVCAIESGSDRHSYKQDVKYVLDTNQTRSFIRLEKLINRDIFVTAVVLQHEYSLFEGMENELIQLLSGITKPLIVAFHTVLPNPDSGRKLHTQQLAATATEVIAMTNASAEILRNDYNIRPEKINVIPHGTHLVTHPDKISLKQKYNLEGRTILSTFGLLSSGKCIETTLQALPVIIESNPDALFLIIGKTHPSVLNTEGEIYRESLEAKVSELKLEHHVLFLNQFMPLPILLDYLQLTDIYLFTSGDPFQAVSGTFAYAISCGCPVISTPIPHAKELLGDDAGTIIDFNNPVQLSSAVNLLLKNTELRNKIRKNGLQRIAPTAWENSAIAHANLIQKIASYTLSLNYRIPAVNLDHLKRSTTEFGIIQFSEINQSDLKSGFTLDDNARALISFCRHYQLFSNEDDLYYIRLYFDFISYCFQPEGYLLNYVGENRKFTDKNNSGNLADANGRAIWALGYLISLSDLLPNSLVSDAELLLQKLLANAEKIHSTRSMAFIIKGLYFRNSVREGTKETALIIQLANRLMQMYRHEATDKWQWFESYITYANSVLPEAMLCAWQATQDIHYKEIAKESFDFLISKIFIGNTIKVISNKSWLNKLSVNDYGEKGGEQPIDVAYTILALSRFYEIFREENYWQKRQIAFNWFLGANHLNQIIYNPHTGGCYDVLEEFEVNINQSAESTISYLMARLAVENSPGNLEVVSADDTNTLQVTNKTD